MLEQQRVKLDEDGYLVLRGMLTAIQLEVVRGRLEELWDEEGSEAGQENYIEVGARRLANLANKDDIFRALMCDPRVLEVVQAVIGPDVRLNMLNARDALPQSRDARTESGDGLPKSPDAQPLHADTDHGGKPDERGFYVCTAIWMIDDFTRANGATRFVPGSHRCGRVPKELMADPYARHPDEIIIEGKAGDVLVFNGHGWHAGRANTSDRQRRAILVHYLRADQTPRLNYREAISEKVQERLRPIEREVLGLG